MCNVTSWMSGCRTRRVVRKPGRHESKDKQQKNKNKGKVCSNSLFYLYNMLFLFTDITSGINFTKIRATLSSKSTVPSADPAWTPGSSRILLPGAARRPVCISKWILQMRSHFFHREAKVNEGGFARVDVTLSGMLVVAGSWGEAQQRNHVSHEPLLFSSLDLCDANS